MSFVLDGVSIRMVHYNEQYELVNSWRRLDLQLIEMKNERFASFGLLWLAEWLALSRSGR